MFIRRLLCLMETCTKQQGCFTKEFTQNAPEAADWAYLFRHPSLSRKVPPSEFQNTLKMSQLSNSDTYKEASE